MQPLYPNRINFENLPSTNTPLGESTLNQIDYAVYGLDQRVLTLYGYEGRVQESEQNAKTSETNAKVSETNAKASEELAKEYMENAFSTTPSGYAELLEDVAEISETSNEALTIAKGKNRSHVFNTTEDMESWLSDESNKGLYQQGDNIYIVDLNVPDWWISEVLEEVDSETGYYYRVAQLETQKVDLTNYYTKEDTDELFDNIEIDANSVVYDNTDSGLNATNVQGAIDEILDDMSPTVLLNSSVTLDGTSKTLVANISNYKYLDIYYETNGYTDTKTIPTEVFTYPYILHFFVSVSSYIIATLSIYNNALTGKYLTGTGFSTITIRKIVGRKV